MQQHSLMRVVSVNIGLPREVHWKGRIVSTGIFKEPVAGRVMARRLNLDGDRQADLSVHGGPEKAIYVYPTDYYEAWHEELPQIDMPWGMFGENLTVEGLRDNTVHIGDQFRIGSALVVVTQPRLPCYKLAIRFGRDDMLKRFLVSGRTGFYLAVVEEGDIAAGDLIMLVRRDEHAISVAEITQLSVSHTKNLEALRRAIALETLPESWREYFRERLDRRTR